MKIQLYHFDNDLDFKESFVHVLQLESKELFTKLLNSFHQIENGIEPQEKIFFYDNKREEIELYHKIRVVIDYLNLDLNGRKELTSVYKRIETRLNDKPEIVSNFSDNIKKTINELKEVLWEEDVIFEFNDYYELSEFLKFIKLKYKMDSYNILEKLMLLIDLEGIFKWNEFLVLVNLSSYLKIDELIKLYDYATYKKVNILVLDTNMNGPTLKNEIKLIIDNDYDEFMLKNS